jgi:hypothetical protein
MLIYPSLRNALITITAISVLSSCVPFKEVSLLSQNSATTLNKELPVFYGYFNYCLDSCMIYPKTIQHLKQLDCDCSQDKTYDSLIDVEYRIFITYFNRLAKLADSKTTISFDPLTKSVQSGNYGSLTITSEEEKVVNALSKVLSGLLTVHFKSKKIKEIISKDNEAFQKAIHFLKLHLENLRDKIVLMANSYQSRSDEMLESSHSDAERWAVAYTYRQQYHQYSNILDRYNAMIRALELISQGHQHLYDHIQTLSSESVKKKILDFASDIYNMH